MSSAFGCVCFWENLPSSRRLSSHSLKATLLSFAAKRSISHSDRLATGHHSHPLQFADVYAGEAQTTVLRLLDKLILEIRSGIFLPDPTRAGRFNMNANVDMARDLTNEKLSHDANFEAPISKSNRLWKLRRRGA